MNDKLTPYPVRRTLDHRGPLSISVGDAVYFITIVAAEREGAPFLDKVDVLLEAARFYQASGRWFLHLFLVMPDHIHMLVHVPPDIPLATVIGRWKHFLSSMKGIQFQKDFFDTRIRDDVHFAEKWKYICRNPVARGLVETPREWQHSIAFDPQTGAERKHR